MKRNLEYTLRSLRRAAFRSGAAWVAILSVFFSACYDDGVDLRAAVRSGQGESLLAQAIEQAILRKPARHCFDEAKAVTERKAMNEIGG